VYERDIEWLEACDILIADASGSSFGVGFEVGYVLARSDRTGQRVLLLYSSSREHAVSRLIVGNAHPRCIVQKYEDPEDLILRVSQSLTSNA
jgi:nucleoside 2-deoxyribosyltransferase